MSLVAGPQTRGWNPALGLGTSNASVEASTRSITSNASSQNSHASLSRSISALTTGSQSDCFHLPARLSEQIPGTFSTMLFLPTWQQRPNSVRNVPCKQHLYSKDMFMGGMRDKCLRAGSIAVDSYVAIHC